jgi:hypothetical protein
MLLGDRHIEITLRIFLRETHQAGALARGRGNAEQARVSRRHVAKPVAEDVGVGRLGRRAFLDQAGDRVERADGVVFDRPFFGRFVTLALGRHDVDQLRAGQALDRLQRVAGDGFAPLGETRFDLVVSNPPYIEEDDAHLCRGDLRFEPASALASGRDGLDDIRRIVRGAGARLAHGGWLLMEHGWNQGLAVRAIFAEAGFIEASTAVDLEGRERVTGGTGRKFRLTGSREITQGPLARGRLAGPQGIRE